MLNPLVAASKECKETERAGRRARWHGAAGEQEDRTCSGAQANSRDWRASEGSAGRGGMAGVRQKRAGAGREQQQQRETGRTKSAAGSGQAVEQQPDAV